MSTTNATLEISGPDRRFLLVEQKAFAFYQTGEPTDHLCHFGAHMLYIFNPRSTSSVEQSDPASCE